MDLRAASAQTGLTATATPTSTDVTGSVQIGAANATTNFTGCDVVYSLQAIIVNTDVFQIVTSTGVTSGSDTWSAGTAQVETATAAGTITLAGNATVTVTAAGMTGSPKAISVAVTLSDTAATWAGKVRTALAADTDVSALFTVGGTTTAISLTRKVSSLGILPANDATLNIALANGTCTGITNAATSADTTAGVASSGALITDGDAKDFEGVAIPTITNLKGIFMQCVNGEINLTSSAESGNLKAGQIREVINNTSSVSGFLSTLTFTAAADSKLKLTIVGATA